ACLRRERRCEGGRERGPGVRLPSVRIRDDRADRGQLAHADEGPPAECHYGVWNVRGGLPDAGPVPLRAAAERVGMGDTWRNARRERGTDDPLRSPTPRAAGGRVGAVPRGGNGGGRG